MPEHEKGLAVLEHFLRTRNDFENIVDQMTRNIELARKNKYRHSIAVELPMFTIKSDISVVKHMNEVNRPFIKIAFRQ